MRNLVLGVAAAASLLGASAAAQAAPSPLLVVGVDGPRDTALVEKTQFYAWGGRNYCWYDDAWRGPGYYWCGYAWRRGYGWGGAYGWNGWRGGYGPRGWYGPRANWDRRWDHDHWDHWDGGHWGHDRGDRDHGHWRR